MWQHVLLTVEGDSVLTCMFCAAPSFYPPAPWFGPGPFSFPLRNHHCASLGHTHPTLTGGHRTPAALVWRTNREVDPAGYPSAAVDTGSTWSTHRYSITITWKPGFLHTYIYFSIKLRKGIIILCSLTITLTWTHNSMHNNTNITITQKL